MKPIYLDVCSLCRPFDDQSYIRIRLETEAVNLIISKVHLRQFKLMVSPVHYKEIKDIPDIAEKIELILLLKKVGHDILPNFKEIQERAEELIQVGFGIADAAHIAFAEQSGAPFISCDDKLVKKSKKYNMKVWVGTPISFCEKENLK